MNSQQGYSPWFKLNSREWNEESFKSNYKPEERGIWLDLLCLANECNSKGILNRGGETLYTREEIAIHLGVPLATLNITISKALKDKRMKKLSDGTLAITNWGKYNPNKGK